MTFPAVGEAFVAIFLPTPGLRGENIHFVSSGFSTERILL